MARTFCIPGLFFLVAAFALSFLVSVSLPYLPALDIARTHFGSTTSTGGPDTIIESRLGIWAHCDYRPNGDKICSPRSHGYTVGYQAPNGNVVVINPSWTRGLAVHPVATAVAFFALLFGLSTHVTATLIASLTSFLAATLTLIAFAIDIALFVYLRHQTNKLTSTAPRTHLGPGFWMNFVALLLLLFGGCTVCFGRRRERMAGASTYPTSKPGFFSRFRRQ